MSSALITWGGWDGHEPQQTAEIAAEALRNNDFDVEMVNTLDVYTDEEKMSKLDLIVPVWTMASITQDQLNGLLNAVKNGCGIAGWHGGMGDSFRMETEYQLMVGGQWVAHPGGDTMTYKVYRTNESSPITAGIEEFTITSEQYYMHVDPANRVLMATNFGDTVMPAVWTKTYGEGKVFYCSVGHVAKDFRVPEVLTIVTRGMLWAAGRL
jgi:type 1 glutamine amidotransferase